MIVNLQKNKENMNFKPQTTKKCAFCQNSHNGEKIIDNVNSSTNKNVISCVENYLRLFKNDSYLGCYKINYCPICGRNLNNQ